MKTTKLTLKITTILLALLMCVSLIACQGGNGKNEETTEKGSSTTGTTPATEEPTTAPEETTDPEEPTSAPDDETTAPDDSGTTEPPVVEEPANIQITTTAGDTFTFYKGLPSFFQGEDVIMVDCNDYDKDSSQDVQSSTQNGVTHRYTNPSKPEAKLVIKVVVSEAGKYDFCLDLRMKDDSRRYNSISVNGSTPIVLDPKMTPAEAETYRDETQSTFMVGLSFDLVAGENTIEITNPEVLNTVDYKVTMHWRKIYLVKADETSTSDPDAELTKLVINSTAGVAQTFYNGLPAAYKAANAIKIDCNTYDQSLSVGVKSADYQSITHRYTDPTNANARLVFKVTVTEAGTYNLCIDMRMKDDAHRWNSISVNGSTPVEMDFKMESTAVAEANRDATESAYMTGYQLELKAGENIIEISIAASQSLNTSHKTMHLRNLYLVKANVGA